MAAANESQGLKIAVAAFVSLTVILAVTSYFLFSNYSDATEKLSASEDNLRKSKTAEGLILKQYEELKGNIGSRAEEYEAVKGEIKAANDKINKEIGEIGPMVVEMVGKVQAAGGNSPALEEVKNTAQSLLASYQGEPNKNFISSLARVTDMLKNQARLTTSVALAYVDQRRSLESVNIVNKQQLDVEAKAKSQAQADVASEHTKHDQARADLLAKIDLYQTEINNKATEIATLNTQLRQLREDSTKKQSDLLNIVREHQDAKAQVETILDRPDGRITFVDYNRGEVRTNLTHSMGARPQMKLTIFDTGSPGIPTERPKGTIELTFVGDNYSLGKITKTMNPVEPIRLGDIVYSPAWSPNEPMRFALIGKMDVNRDGKDDRADLIRMITAAGGIVDYDLPPPFIGKEQGKLTGRDAWYITDDRQPLRNYERDTEDQSTVEYADFLKKRSVAIREARDNGVRPMRIERLLAYLGFDYSAPIRGRVEAVDRSLIKNLGRARQDATKKAETPAAPAEEGATPATEDMPKEEEK
ncbi:coiled-coil domain-containing protein [Singulisphaera rosea]